MKVGPQAVADNAGETEGRAEASWGDGPFRFHQVRPHVSIHWGHGQFDKDYRVNVSEESSVVFLAIAVAGGWRERHQGFRGDFCRFSGQMSLIHGPSLVEHCALRSESSIHLTAAIALEEFTGYFAGDGSAGALRALRLARGDGCPNLTLPMGPRVGALVERVRRCPLRGALRMLAMESLFAGMLTEMIQSLSDPAGPCRNTCRWLRADEERIRAAASLLNQRMEEPPSLAELARSVGLCESKLKRGFHRVFGRTAFGYLRGQRMHRARQLLETGEATVLETASLVGYHNPSHFAAAFRQEFGVNPKQFQLVAGG